MVGAGEVQLISLMVSVDVKHHVYLLTIEPGRENESGEVIEPRKASQPGK